MFGLGCRAGCKQQEHGNRDAHPCTMLPLRPFSNPSCCRVDTMAKRRESAMRPASCMFATVALFCPALAAAQNSSPAPSTTDERRLTAEQVEAVLAEAAA